MDKIFQQWRQFLTEAIKPPKYDGPTLASQGVAPWHAQYGSIKASTLESVFKVFHMSERRLERDGNFKFTPRVPRNPWENDKGDVIEDDFTKRISLAPRLELAAEALDGASNFHVYAGDIKLDVSDDIPVKKLDVELRRCKDDLSTSDNEYDYNFDIDKYIDKNPDAIKGEPKPAGAAVKPSDLTPKYRKKFYACVPDAEDTHEMWAKRPIELYSIGTYNEFTNEVILSKEGFELLSFIKRTIYKK